MPEPEHGGSKRFQVAVVAALLLLAFFVARTCQQAQIRVDKEQAIATARKQVDFEPEGTQIRLLRQGLNRKPFWFVSMSVRDKENPDIFSRLAVVRIDANTGKVESVQEEAARDGRAAEEAKKSEVP